MEKQYWTSLEQLPPEGEFRENPLQIIDAGHSRRGFLLASGFAFLTGCARAPVEKAMPFVKQPEDAIAGRALYYASTCGGCTAACPLLVKVRDGRPIKLEGQTCAAGQASILGLYDSLRLKQPLAGGKPAAWADIDAAIIKGLQGGAVRYLSQTIVSPSKQAAIDRFLAQFKDARHVVWDPLSASAILDAHERTHGARVLPHYRFDRAEVIVSFDADFLGTWISPVEFARGYTSAKKYHEQYEGRLSVTGSKADRRVRMSPAEMRARLADLAANLAKHPIGRAPGRSLVVSGINDVHVQALVNQANHLLGNYGATLDIEHPSRQRQGSDRELMRLFGEIEAGKVAALLIDGVNPGADLPAMPDLKRVPLIVSFAGSLDETSSRAHFVCPDHHYLESWADNEAVAGTVTFTQPGIRPLGSTRAVVEALAVWSGKPQSQYEILRDAWKHMPDFERFWAEAIEDGSVEVPRAPVKTKPFQAPLAQPSAKTEGYTVALYPSVAMLDGRHAYNPWLHELPDPITKVTWDNFAAVSPAAAKSLGVSDGDVLKIEGLELPVVVQPGQHDSVISIALGYGRKTSERFANLGPRWINAHQVTGAVGINAAPLLWYDGTSFRYERHGVPVTRTGRRVELAQTQTHHTLEGRNIIQEAGRHEEEEPREELWPDDHPYPGHRWGMAVDLNACNGCSACVIACQVENNTPVVGRDEVRRRREMHWIRIDRYYTGSPDDPQVAHQPMMCQQCDHAPCETVCPVLATVHSDEGLNQQVYNRCVGTRYCANNCPYKVRRFNWFDYPREDRLANLVLNPDVTVRTRGVMEKCTFCVQRIQEAKIEAKRLGVPVKDGDIRTACEQACPVGAIVFGDLNDRNSRVAKLARDQRQYRVLEELNVRPSVHYLKIVRNASEEKHNG